MHKQLWFTDALNYAFGGLTNALLSALGIHAHDPAHPITDPVSMQILVALLLFTLFLVVRSRLSVESPGRIQHVFETFHTFVDAQAHQIIGHHYERYVPYVSAVALFILLSNLIGLVPSFLSPTQFPYVPAGLAIATFIYYNFHGVRHHGIGYVRQFIGPVPALAPLMVLIEIVSHLARVLSLTVRLYANMFAGEMVTLAFFSLIPLGVPLIFQGLHLLVAFVQTLIFALLTMAYLALAVSEEH
jgi:F-type H+-transporting ATPase subunit a